jgi:hypothetical protein
MHDLILCLLCFVSFPITFIVHIDFVLNPFWGYRHYIHDTNLCTKVAKMVTNVYNTVQSNSWLT